MGDDEEPSEHDAAVRNYRDAVDAQAREERDKAADAEVAYAVKVGAGYRAAKKLRKLKVIQNLRKNRKKQ